MRVQFWSVLVPLAASSLGAATFDESFSGDPSLDGWKGFGNTNLFTWNSTNKNLEVTWDSSQPNSYFYRPIGTMLGTNDDFSIAFDLRLDDLEVGGFGFELALGFMNFADATNADFLRGTGRDAPNVAEFDYFPDTGFGASIDGTLEDSTATNFHFFYLNLPLELGTVYHITLNHPANSAEFTGQVFANGELYGDIAIPYLTPKFFDFRVDTLSISSFSDERSFGSILAHGVVDNLAIEFPPPPIQNVSGVFTNGVWGLEFPSQSNWVYTLERTTDFRTWADVSIPISGTGAILFLMDTNSIADKAFYRARAYRP